MNTYLVAMKVHIYIAAESQADAEQQAEQLDVGCMGAAISDGEVLDVTYAYDGE